MSFVYCSKCRDRLTGVYRNYKICKDCWSTMGAIAGFYTYNPLLEPIDPMTSKKNGTNPGPPIYDEMNSEELVKLMSETVDQLNNKMNQHNKIWLYFMNSDTYKNFSKELIQKFLDYLVEGKPIK